MGQPAVDAALFNNSPYTLLVCAVLELLVAFILEGEENGGSSYVLPVLPVACSVPHLCVKLFFRY